MIDPLVRRRRRPAFLVAAALALGACSSTGSDAVSDGASPSPQAPSPRASTIGPSADPSAGSDADEVTAEHLFPTVDVVDVATGETFDLGDELAGGDVPLLLWFWAPH